MSHLVDRQEGGGTLGVRGALRSRGQRFRGLARRGLMVGIGGLLSPPRRRDAEITRRRREKGEFGCLTSIRCGRVGARRKQRSRGLARRGVSVRSGGLLSTRSRGDAEITRRRREKGELGYWTTIRSGRVGARRKQRSLRRGLSLRGLARRMWRGGVGLGVVAEHVRIVLVAGSGAESATNVGDGGG